MGSHRRIRTGAGASTAQDSGADTPTSHGRTVRWAAVLAVFTTVGAMVTVPMARADTPDITGVAYAPDGTTPAAGVTVSATDSSGKAAGSDVVTGQDGAFSLSVPNGATYTIEVSPPNPDPGHWVTNTTSVVVPATGAATPVSISMLAATLTGTVTDSAGKAVSAAILSAQSMSTSSPSGTATPPGSVAQTDSTGSYGLHLAPGSYFLFVNPPQPNSADLVGQNLSLSVPQSGSTTQNVTLPTANVIGTVLDPSGSPVVHTAVQAVSTDGSGTPTTADAPTDDSGTFLFNLPAGSYQLTAQTPTDDTAGWAPGTLSITVGDTPLAGQTVHLQTPTLTGRVLTPDGGAAVTGAGVIAVPTSASPGAPPTAFTAQSASNAVYGLALPDGTYAVTVSPPAGSSYAPSTTTVTVPATNPTDLKLAAANVRGTVFGPDKTTPVPNAQILAVDSNGHSTQASAAADGTYALDLPAGTYELTASDPGGTKLYQPASINITVVDGTPLAGQNIDLGAPDVTGTVTKADGATPASAAVYAYDTNAGTWSNPSVTNSAGQFGFQLAAGTYRLVALENDGTYGQAVGAPFTVAGGSPATVDLRFPAPQPPAFDFTDISKPANGSEPDGSVAEASMSADGSTVAFVSGATNLTADDTLAYPQTGVFVYNTATHAIRFVAVASDAGISPSGRYLAFMSADPGLPGNSTGGTGVWVEDLTAANPTPVRVDTFSGGPSNLQPGTAPSVSDDGRFVTITGYDGNGMTAYVADTTTQKAAQLVDPGGNSTVVTPYVSADGSTVDFLAFTPGGGTNPTYSLDSYSTASGQTANLASMGAGPVAPPFAMSSDGSTVAYAGYDPSGTPTLHIVSSGQDSALSLFDGFGAPPGSSISALAMDGAGDVFLSANSGEAGPSAAQEVWEYHPTTQTTTLVSADSTGAPVLLPMTLAGVSSDGSRALLTAPGDSFAPGAMFTPETNLFLGVPHQASAPTWPQGAKLQVSQVGSAVATLSWTAISDPFLTGYRIFANGSQVAEVGPSTATYTVDGLTPSTPYQFQVQAGGSGGQWTTDGPTAQATTLASSSGASAVATVRLLPSGAVQVSWTAAPGSPTYRVYRTVSGGSPVALTPDTTSTSVTDHPPASSTVSYTVSTLDQSGNPVAYAVGDQSVSVPALYLRSVSWSGDTLSINGATLLKSGSTVKIDAVGSPGYSVSATVTFLQTPPAVASPTAMARRVGAVMARVIPHLAGVGGAPQTSTATVALTEDPANPGSYSGSFPLPPGAAQVVSITANLTDGAGGSQTAAAGQLPVSVAGSLAVAVQAPANGLTGGSVSIYGATTGYWDRKDVTGGGTVTFDAPADTYYVMVSNGQGQIVYSVSGITVAAGGTTPLAASPDFPVGLTVTVTAADTGHPLGGVWVDVVNSITQQDLASGPTGADGVAHISGLSAPVGGMPVTLLVSPGHIPYNAPSQAPTTELNIGDNSASVALTALPTATVTGTVDDPYGEPDPSATVQASISVNGGTWSYSTQTDPSGNYSLTVLAGHLQISTGSPTGWSEPVTTDLVGGQNLTQNLMLQGEVPYTLKVGIATRELGQQSYTPLPAIDWREAVHFNFGVETPENSYNYADFQSAEAGGLPAGELKIYGHKGEVAKACADGSQAQLSPTYSCSSVTLGSDPNGSSVTVNLDATPWVSASLATPAGQPVTDSWTATVTDETTTPPSVLSTRSGSGADLEMPVPAPAGAYHLAIRSGSLYVDQSVDVADATKTDLGTLAMRSSSWFTPDSVPEDNTVTGTPAQALPGDRVSFRAQFQNNGTDITGVTAGIEQPARATLETGSVTLDGQPVTPTKADDGSLTIPIGDLASGKGGVIDYTVTLDPSAKPGSSVGAAVLMSFTAAGSSETEALQSAAIQMAGITLDVPAQVNQLSITTSGRAPANSAVTVYADGAVMGTTTSSAGGYWQVPVTLTDLGGTHYYDLHAEAVYSGSTLHSPDAYVYYNGTVPVVTKVTLWQDDPGNPNGRRFTFYPADGVARFPFVWVPGQVLHAALTFNYPDQVDHVVVQLGSSGDLQPADKQADGTYLVTWQDPNPGDGAISIGFDDVPQPAQLANFTPPTTPQLRSQVPPPFQDFSDTTAAWDTSDPNVLDLSTQFPSANGITATTHVGLSIADYAPTSGDLTQYQQDGVPLFGRSVNVDQTTGEVTVTGYLPLSFANAAPSDKAFLRPRLWEEPPPGVTTKVLKAVFDTEFGKGGLKATVSDIASGLNDWRQTYLGQNYTQLNDMEDHVGDCQNYSYLNSEIDEARWKVVGWDAISVGTGIAMTVGAAKLLTTLTEAAALPPAFAEVPGQLTNPVALKAAVNVASFAAGQVSNQAFNGVENGITDPIQKEIDNCPKFPNAKPRPKKHPGHFGPAGGMTPIEDPSGFVYEGVESNRISGATATLLQASSENGPWTAWNATWFGQQNPLTTDGEGRYAWNVPDGWWKVQFTAPGYQTAYSQPEQVPPPRTGINVGMVSLSPPTLSSATANAGGTITATFSQYMQASTVTSSDLTVLDSTGKAVAGTVTALNAENDPSGTSMARTFTFTPAAGLPGGQLTVQAGPPAFNYAGHPMAAPATVTVTAAPSAPGGVPTGGGGSVPPTTGVWQVAGSTYSSSSAPPSPDSPVVVKVTTPAAGDVSVAPTPAPTPPAGYVGLGQAEQITAPQASASSPLVISFDVDRSALPQGVDDSELTVTRDGSLAGSCPGASAVGAVDPCVSSVVDHGAYVTITVLSTHASTWAEVAGQYDRLAGADRIGTAVAVSQAFFGPGMASAAVLARSDDYADGLAGGPLAAAKGGPLLLSASGALPASVAAELSRALAPGATVYLLGGTSALSASVEQSVTGLGFKTVRLAGPDRYATAVAVAGALGSPSTVLLASGTDYPDALTAGAAAAYIGGAVLLTSGTTEAPATTAYLAAHASDKVYSVGGPAAHAAPKAAALVGADRYATAVAVAKQFFPGATGAGLATGLGYADALSAGAVLGPRGEPLLLTDPSGLSTAVQDYIQAGIVQLHVFGGPAAVGFSAGGHLATRPSGHRRGGGARAHGRVTATRSRR